MRDDEPNLIYENEPQPIWTKFYFREPEWWRYDQILSDECFKKMDSTGQWTINEIKKRKILLEYGMVKIETSDGQILEDMSNIFLDEEIGETLSVYYSEKIILGDDDKDKIESDFEIYNDENQITILKPPFHRMIVEMDIARRIGGYSREDILGLSKKDIDTIYFLHRIGMYLPIKDYARAIQPISRSDDMSSPFEADLEKLKQKSMEVRSILANE